jgi:hypothetical protein
MNKKITLILLLLVSFATTIFAKEVNRSNAEKVAVSFYYQKSNQYSDEVNYYDINIVDSYLVDNAYYVINFENGWILISADDAMIPVLGYSFKGSFPSPDATEMNLNSLLSGYVNQINYIRSHKIEAGKEIADSWNYYLTTSHEDFNLKGGKNVDPLIDPILWNQDYPWNVLCPPDVDGPGGFTYVGCVATAMSQIMLYWRYPLIGQGQKSYYLPEYGTISAKFDTTHYNWDGMKCQMDTRNVYDMALIGFHAGVSVNMDYDPEGSGAQSNRVPTALKTYFRYASTAKYIKKEDFSWSYWESKIQSELNAKRPLYYSGYDDEGGGHAFVCDGYQSDTPSNYYHFNFGWAGSGNGFYTLYDVGGFHNGQGMAYGIYPNDPDYPYIAEGTNTLTALAGSLTDGSGPIENYPSGMDAQWLISPQSSKDSVTNIKIHFVKMKTHPNDTIKIYEGPSTDYPLHGAYSGVNMPSDFTINTNQVLVTFSSTHSYDGFIIEYSTSPATWCSGTSVVAEPYGTVTDGSDNGFYYNNGTLCTFVLQHPEAVKYNIDFTEFNTEPQYDKLTIYTIENNLVGEYSGFDLPSPIQVETKGLVLFWETNAVSNYQGWSFDFTVNGVGVSETMFNTFNIYPNPAKNMLNVNFSIEKANNVKVMLTNLNGQTVFQENLNTLNGEYNKTIDVSKFIEGVYILSITTNKGKATKKVVIQ